MSTFSKTEKYLSAFSVSGREQALAEIIACDMKQYCDEIHTDSIGNLICFKRGRDSSKKLMIASHMDEIGFVATYIEANGFIRVAAIGGINAVASSFSAVRFENGTKGVIVTEAGTEPKDIAAGTLLVDIGASTREEAEGLVSVGDVLAVAPFVQKLSFGRISAKAFDDRICCVIASEAASKVSLPAYDTYYVFTVQEEVGYRGSRAAANAILPDYAVALDVTTAFDVPGSKKLPGKLGNGACVKVKDSSVICSALLNKRLCELADKNNIKWQYEILTAGGTDTSQMQLAGAGAHATCISLATRYIHTPVEVIDKNDLDCCVKLLSLFIEKGIE